jgi:hypothetical protein
LQTVEELKATRLRMFVLLRHFLGWLVGIAKSIASEKQ